MANVSARLARVRSGLTPQEWTRAGVMVAIVIGLNVAGWVMLAAAVGGHYHITNTEIFGFGTGALAYTLGMRHAFDADHIAAIDNTTRKLVNDGKRPRSASSSPSATRRSCSSWHCCSTSASGRLTSRSRTTTPGCTPSPASSAPASPAPSCTSSPC
jgi:hypothetical protein